MTIGLSVATMYGNVQNAVWLPWQPFKSRTLISWGLFVTTTRRNTELLVHNHMASTTYLLDQRSTQNGWNTHCLYSNREAQGLSHADHWSVVVSWPCHACNWSKAWYTVHVTGSRREIVNNTVIQHVKTTQLDAPPTSKLSSPVNIPNKQTCHMYVWHDMVEISACIHA